MYGEFFLIGWLNSSDYFCFYTEFFAVVDEFFGSFFMCIYFHAMSHVEHLIHFQPFCAGSSLNQFEQRWALKEVVFNDMPRLYIVEYFGLCATTAMNESVYIFEMFLQEWLENGEVGARRGEECFPYV